MDKREPWWPDSFEMPSLQGTAGDIIVSLGIHRGWLQGAMQIVWAQVYDHKSAVFK